MSARPADHVTVPPYAPAPGAPAELRTLLRADRRADWVPAFERDRAKAREDALHEVVRTWQLRVAAAPAVDAFMDPGRDESGFVDLGGVLGRRG
ncbi:hypothetical protein ACH4XT_31110 [Streptomyces avidinii]|uniref:hypothetical protein n=1 Tax=Streptomyces avidinii TaxID=1895 RepID=UPI0037B8008A